MRECSYCGTHLSAPSRPLAGGEDLLRRDGAAPFPGRGDRAGPGGAERHLDGWMEVSGPAPVRFTNRYVIRETDRPFTLTWQSFNPVLGVLEGTFELAGESILSRYVSPGPGVLRL